MSGTILLADDSPTIQKVVELTFSETPHEVVAVSSGTELMDKLGEIGPDLVICDVIMPDRDGYDLCQAIKSDPATLHIPVVMLTGTFEPFDRDRAMAVGCDDIVTKPFEARHLIDTVENLLGGGAPVTETTPASPESEEYGTFLVEGGGDAASEEVESPEAEAPEVAAEPFGVEEAEAEAEADDEDALDFTATGFDEMEARAEEVESGDAPEVAAPPPEPEEEGLDFTTTGFDRMEAAGRAEMGEEPEAESEPEAEPEKVRSPADTDEIDMPLGEREDAGAGEIGTGGSAWEDSFGGGDEAAEPEPVEEPEAGAVEEPEPVEPEPEGVEEPEPPSPEPEPEPEPEAVEVEPEPEAEPTPLPVPETDEPRPAVPEGSSLSDEDVERIARRVVELQADRLKQIAWEVVPDMAEILVRERIQQLEAEMEPGEEE